MTEALEYVLYGLPETIIGWGGGLWKALGFRPVVLGSDVLVFALTLGALIWLYLAMKREFWRVAVRQVLADRIAMLSLGVLSVYLVIGMLDTLHYRPVDDETPDGGRIASVLDRICRPLTERRERTYSEPFATYSFTMETQTAPDGTQTRVRPALEFAGSHLENRNERGGDIVQRVATGIGLGAIMMAVLVSLFYAFRRRREKRKPAWKCLGFWAAVFFGLVAMDLACCAKLSEGYHVLGTDKTGQDVLFVSLKSVRTGLVIGTLTTFIVTPFAILFGVLAGYIGGWVDDVIQYIYTTLASIPDVLLIAAAMLVLRQGVTPEETAISADKRLVYLCLILGITSWTGLCRLIRAETLKLRELEYVQAADAFGISKILIMLRHLIPNVMHIVLISVVLRFSGLVLSEAVLAYIGIGVDPSMQSWGNMIYMARLELARDPAVWWSLLAAFVFMLGLVLPANLFGDAVRDALDPRLRTR